MEKFSSHTGTVLPLQRSNVDTDQIIPAVYLKRITRHGFEDGLFAAWRKDSRFALNRPEFAGATILVAGSDFGTGSSREHAVWALQDYGFKVVISSRFADIFRGNSLKAGLVTLEMSDEVVAELWALAIGDPTSRVTVDLVARQLQYAGRCTPIAIDDYARWRLIEGADDVSLTQRHLDDVTKFEGSRPPWLPQTLPR